MYRLVRIVAALAVIGGTAVAVSSPAEAAACAGTGTAEIVSLTFDPPAIAAGDTVQATVTAQNCTATAQTASVQWYGRFTGPGGGIPADCIAMDPLLVPLALPAGGTNSAALTFRTFASCSATGLEVNVQLRADAGTVADTRTATVPIGTTTTSPGCKVVYTRGSEWPGGFVATITVTNTGTAPINGWSVGFTFPGDQTIASAWNAAVTQTGSTVTAANLAYNRVLNPAAATSFGLRGTWHTSDAPPTSFTLNGRTC